MDVQIVALSDHHEAQWRLLWSGYLEFYETRIDPAVTDHTWNRLAHPQSGLFGIGAECDGELVGFATVVLHPATWSIDPTAYLEDLFVTVTHRGRGVGRALIEAILERARMLSWSSVYWHTGAGNDQARRLYDSFTKADNFVRYRIQSPFEVQQAPPASRA